MVALAGAAPVAMSRSSASRRNIGRLGIQGQREAYTRRRVSSHKQPLDSLGVPHRRVQKLIRFDRDEVMAWARRWLQAAKDQGIDMKADPAGQYRSLQQALASLPA